ncbi:MAG: tRNA (adenosine(37)-N6)-dimethylallyltransferase MiaA [Actinomycetota bacterium]|nr:tRNA (adenosine(37)-N6)-dimethylallyltransferase MiaA [Actinomycetota bacterium]
MATGQDDRPFVIVGPTASGKSAVAMELARRLGGEVLTVDSMQVYRGMDIGTAKPTLAEQAETPHHLVDLIEPEAAFTLVDFQQEFDRALAEVRDRGAVPVITGGTGLYLRAAIDRLTPPPQYPDVVAELEAEPDTVALHGRLATLDPLAASRMEPTNRRRVMRALSVTIGSGEPFSSYGPGLEEYAELPYRMIGIEIDRPLLDQRIADRYQQQMADGFLDEVKALADRELSHTAVQALGYKELLLHLRGDADLEAALDLARQRTRKFARRQQRWFRRDPRIEWVGYAEADVLADRLIGGP